MKISEVLILIFSAVCGGGSVNVTTSEHAEDLRMGHPGFLLNVPQRLTSGKKALVCLTIHEALPPTRIKIDLKYKEMHYYTDKLIDSGYSCFEMNVPSHNRNTPQYVSVKVQVQLDGIVYSSHNQDPVLIYPEKLHTFIGLDRTIYKPGDRMRMRILILEDNLRPPEDYKITEVRIRNSLDIAVAVWENISTTAGLIQLEHQIFKDAILGKWRVEVNGETKQFEIGKYVLPRFNINILYPKIIYYGAKFLELRICSKYTFGKEVKGKAFVKITDSHGNMKPLYEIHQMTNGCAKFKILKSQLHLTEIRRKFPMYDPKIQLHVTATVIEYGTDKIEIENVKISVDPKEYHLKFVSDNIFQPGLPYHGKLQFSNIHTDVRQDVVEICYNVAIKKSWNYLNNEKCSNFTIGKENGISFSILPLKNSVIHFRLTARSLSFPMVSDSLLVIRLHSLSNDYIILKPNNNFNRQCMPTQQFLIIYTTEKLKSLGNITFFSVVKSRGQLYSVNKITKKIQRKSLDYRNELKNIIGNSHKYNTDGSILDKFVLKFNIDDNILWKYQILIYYVAENGEIISASKEVERGPCLRNKVETYWTNPEIHPGAKATLNIRTSSPSLCSISSADTAVEFMAAADHLNTNTIIKNLFLEPSPVQSNRKACITQTKKTVQVPSFYTDLTPDTDWDSRRRRKRYIYPFSEDYDGYDTFNKFGTVTISNLKIVTKPCYSGPRIAPYNPAPFQTDRYNLQNDDTVVSIRTYFPETWIWEITPVRTVKQMQKDLPHSITKWTTNVMCISPTEGLGASPPTEVRSFQPFFVDILTPYSIKRGEILHLRILLFNYIGHNLPVKISASNSNTLKFLNSRNEASYCISSGDSIAHVIPLSGFEVGDATVTVHSEIDPLFPGHCGPETIVNVRDVVVKHFIVEPEGYPVESTKSSMLCNSDIYKSSNISWNIHVPNNIVPNTAKAKLSLNADLLGKPLENLENLLEIPNGCGEQIMATMAPNIFILKYLQSSKNLDTAIRQRAIKNMKIGYQKILNYALRDGSFSPFGHHDSLGSMFLTAFVIRTLQLAKAYIYVDQRVIGKAVSWIFSHQLENGCFDTMLHVFQDMGDTKTENSTSALSSYVISSLLDAEIIIPKTVMDNAKYCIRGYSNPGKYTLAISCYALFRIKWYDEANKILKRLLNTASKQNNMLWWSEEEHGQSEATDIEITSYVLLSMLDYNSPENLAYAHSIVRWLTTKIGPLGGFKSTQDTVVALDALTKYSTVVGLRKINLDIQIHAERQHLNYQIQNDDRLKTKKISLKTANNDIDVKIRGEGCLLVQSVVTYYLKNVPRSESFKVALEVAPVSTVAQCSIATVSPCVAYIGPETYSNMAVLDITLPSGYIVDRASLYKLTEIEKESKVKMFEEIKDRVVFYFTKLDKELRCFSFAINENVYVENRKETKLKMFDYYRPEFENIELYTLDNCTKHAGSISTTENIMEEESFSQSTLSYWDYIDTTVNVNETMNLNYETTFSMKLEDYIAV